jgi:GNAT superfamily N-acetyltransferase
MGDEMTAQLNTATETLERDRLRARPEAPVLPEGYVMRPARLDDVEAAVAMFNAHARRLIGADEFTVEDYRREWSAPGVNLDTDVRVVVAPDGQIIGCMEVWDLWAPHVRVNVWQRVHPDHEGRGIGAALLRWAESRARQAIDKAPEGARVSMATHCLTPTRRRRTCSARRASSPFDTAGACTSTWTRRRRFPHGPRASRCARCASARTSGP